MSDADNRLMRAALAYAAAGFAVFPCRPGRKDPMTPRGLHAASRAAAVIEAWWREYPKANIGCATGAASGFWALDIDMKEANGREGFRVFREGREPIGQPPTQITGRGALGRGLQLLFKYTEPMRNRAGLFNDIDGGEGPIAPRPDGQIAMPGVDTRGDGGYILLPPSLHPSGVNYEWHIKPRGPGAKSGAELEPAPEWLLALCRPRVIAERDANLIVVRPIVADKYAQTALDGEFDKVASAPKGQRNRALNNAAFALGGLIAIDLISNDEAHATLTAAAHASGLMAEDGAANIAKVIASGIAAGMRAPRSVETRATQPQASNTGRRTTTPHIGEGGTNAPPPRGARTRSTPTGTQLAIVPKDEPQADIAEPLWRAQLSQNADGGMDRRSFLNACLFFGNEPAMRGVLAFDEFSRATVAVLRPPWISQGGARWVTRELNDIDDAGARRWLETKGLKASTNDCHAALNFVASHAPFHPVRDAMARLKWDGYERLQTWLPDYLGTDQSAYTADVGTKWMIGGVARVMMPGAKVDSMLIIEGPQGLRKSSALSVLATFDGVSYFSDSHAAIGSKDAIAQIQGKLIVEMAELDALKGASQGAINSWMTTRVDRFRPPYGRRAADYPRQCIFAGTTNPDGSGYLLDPTGGRRFWPVRATKVDLEALHDIQNQLWAEAISRYHDGQRWWIEADDILEEAQAEQAKRYNEDVWAVKIDDFVRGKDMVTIQDILALGLHIEAKDMTMLAQKRVAQHLRFRGYERSKQRLNGGKPVNVFMKGDR